MSFAHKRPSWGFRLIAAFAAAVVLALVVFSASPQLHGWLHSYDAPGSHGTQTSHGPGPVDQDDDCAVVMFSQGVLAALLIAFFGVFAGRAAMFSRVFVSRLVSRAPGFWLPPLCGPPLS